MVLWVCQHNLLILGKHLARRGDKVCLVWLCKQLAPLQPCQAGPGLCSSLYCAYNAKQRIQVIPSSLLCNTRSFPGKKSLCSRGRRNHAMVSERARAPRVTGSIVPCSSALSLQGPQVSSKASEGREATESLTQQKDPSPGEAAAAYP